MGALGWFLLSRVSEGLWPLGTDEVWDILMTYTIEMFQQPCQRADTDKACCDTPQVKSQCLCL